MAEFAIFGASGFIGSHLSNHLVQSGHTVYRLGRGDAVPDRAHAVYCIGLTADFRSQPNATAQAHVGLLASLLETHTFGSFLYLSSTRVYAGATAGREDTPLLVRPQVPDDLYNLTKLTGESLCLAQANSAFRVARLSNVIGIGAEPANFLTSVVNDAINQRSVTFQTSPQSSKDYVDVSDVCRALEAIALNGRSRIYNVASGTPTTNADIAALLTEKVGAKVAFAPNAPTSTFPQIHVDLLQAEFGFSSRSFSESFEMLLTAESQQRSKS